jgi:hypothetical protein
MNLPLRDYIEQRRDAIKTQLAVLKQELRELAIAENAIRAGVPSDARGPSTRTFGEGHRQTIKDKVVNILKNRVGGADANEIISMISDTYGETVVRESLSPQLSRLKQEGLLTLNGKIWSLSLEKKDSETTISEPFSQIGGSEVRGRALPTESPEGANPSASIPVRPSHNFSDLDDEVPF